MVTPHTCPTVRLNPSNTVSVSGELRSNKVPKLQLGLTVLDSIYLRCIPAGELRTRKRRQLAAAEVERVRVRIEEN